MSKKPFRFSVESWSVEQQNKEYETPIFNLFKHRLRLNSENIEGDFYIIDAPNWVNVIAITADREVVLVEQFRFGVDKPSLEIPGGVCDPGESPLETAKRELQEETGYISKKWSSLGKVSANPAIMNNYNYFFLAEECEPNGTMNLDQHERIKVHKLSYQDFLDRVEDGTIDHSIVVAAVAKLLLRET
ncbi:NUDIX hydrolase [Aliifodinibius sp. S!AR15-10]|uniref:NUDIX hydrolase n=1 Tax=Aliifodinibius sp. S!AR15-10 TaxID=2950437 RepID=UPI002858282C|nr:NUDIX hydrolase [Aliifodinibius sp. S!AR15-10]MDR8393721.1 NUDIX hydrolase [Aliifodinibius sp. S!AR15-10]